MFNILLRLTNIKGGIFKNFAIPYTSKNEVYNYVGNILRITSVTDTDKIYSTKKHNFRSLLPSKLIEQLPPTNLIILGFSNINCVEQWKGNTTNIVVYNGFNYFEYSYNNFKNSLLKGNTIGSTNKKFKNKSEILFLLYNMSIKYNSRIWNFEFNKNKPAYSTFMIKCSHGIVKPTTYNNYYNSKNLCSKECHDPSKKIKDICIKNENIKLEELSNACEYKQYTILSSNKNSGIHEKSYMVECDNCGDIKPRSRGNILHSLSKCKKCFNISITKSYDEYVEECTNALLFKKMTLLNPLSPYNGVKDTIHNYECDVCGYNGSIGHDKLINSTNGCKSCAGHNQKYAYIQLIMDNEKPLGIKYGIESISGNRTQQQNSKSVYDIVRIKTFEFSTSEECKAAEIECKKIFQKENRKLYNRNGFISKQDMKDGWSETTIIQNTDKIIEIYKKYNAVEVDNTTLEESK